MTDIPPGHPETLPFPHLTGYWVNRLGAVFRTAVDRELREYDLTRRQAGTLMHIARGLASSASELTRAMAVDSTAVTRMIDRLEEKGLVERQQDPSDGRRQTLHLTGAAQKLLPKLRGVARSVESRFEAGIPKAQLAVFHGVLMTMLENVGEDHFKALEESE